MSNKKKIVVDMCLNIIAVTIPVVVLPVSYIHLDVYKRQELIKEAEKQDLPYLTILFHDYQFCKGYATEREWYKWLIGWLKANDYQFISYKDAIVELERNAKDEKQ